MPISWWARAPLVFAFHGTGGDERQLVPLARRLVPGATVVAPRGDVVAVAVATGQIAVQRVATGEDVATIDLTLPIEDAATLHRELSEFNGDSP